MFANKWGLLPKTGCAIRTEPWTGGLAAEATCDLKPEWKSEVPYSDLIPAGVADQNMVKVLRDKYDKDRQGRNRGTEP